MRYEAVYEGRCGCGGVGTAPLPPEGARRIQVGDCRPFMKYEKDAPKFLACQKIANELGPLNTSRKVFAILGQAAGGEAAERFGVLTLDTHMHMRGLWETGAGETDSVQAPRVPTLNAAIHDMAAAAVIYHVHPAASARPSDADIEVTRMFDQAFQAVGIVLVDHVIVAVGSRRGYFSFADSMPETLPPPE